MQKQHKNSFDIFQKQIYKNWTMEQSGNKIFWYPNLILWLWVYWSFTAQSKLHKKGFQSLQFIYFMIQTKLLIQVMTWKLLFIE